MTKTAYSYDENTRELKGSIPLSLDVVRSQREGKECYLLPANSTLQVPLKLAQNKTNVFNGTTWELVSDYRNQYVTNENFEITKIKKIGNIPDGLILITAEQKAQIESDSDFYIIEDGALVVNPNYETEQENARRTTFENQFFQIPVIENVFIGGWYRKTPKGYSSAIESLNTAFNAVLMLNKLPANQLIFYTKPDYANVDECTEQWLIAHQFKNEEMTKEQFIQFYSAFVTAWNATEH